MASGLTKTADTGVGSRIMGPKQVTEMKVARGSSESERAGEGHKKIIMCFLFLLYQFGILGPDPRIIYYLFLFPTLFN